MDLWLAFCDFHAGDFDAASKVYQEVIKINAMNRGKDLAPQEKQKRMSVAEGALSLFRRKSNDPVSNKANLDDVYLYLASCQFFLGMYEEASATLERISGRTPLRNRLELHLALKSGDDKELTSHREKLGDNLEDQLSLASVHYLTTHYQEAIDIYKKILLEHREYLALNVYVALCYYKLDYYDVSHEVLSIYLNSHPDSVTAMNLKACNHYRLYNGKAAEVRGCLESKFIANFYVDLERITISD